ncbi:MAG: tetratricopeptide repeat protein [Gammaproteobacteria bacterium]|nr:tetratricopeptide repeat protein [Gammaproteobacteria bacterium]
MKIPAKNSVISVAHGRIALFFLVLISASNIAAAQELSGVVELSALEQLMRDWGGLVLGLVGAILGFMGYIEAKKTKATILTGELEPVIAPSEKSDVAGHLAQAHTGMTINSKALRTQSKSAFFYNNIGVTLKSRGKINAAIVAYRKALLINPEYAQAYYNLGIALMALNKTEEAIEAYNKALWIDPEYVDTHYNLGNAYRVLNKTEDAIRSFRKALQIDPSHVWAYNNMGISLMNLGQVDEAIKCFRAALKIDANFTLLHDNLRHALKQAGEGKKSTFALVNGRAQQGQNQTRQTQQSVVRLASNV